MSWYARVMRRAGHTRWFAWLGRRIAPPVDRFLHRVSGGRVHAAEAFLPTLLLTTTGRRSGQLRTQPLAYVEVDDTPYVVGTNWGGEPSLRPDPVGDPWRGARNPRIRGFLGSGDDPRR